MSENKKYYYLKLKDNFFEQDHIKYIESMTHGYIYSNILMKLYLKAVKHEGCLRITEDIPYDPDNIEPMARVIGHDPSHVNEALNLAISFKILTITEAREMWFTDFQEFIGQSSTEADRKKKYREQLKTSDSKELTTSGQMSGQTSDERPPELELEIEIEKELEIEIYKEPHILFTAKWFSLLTKHTTKIRNIMPDDNLAAKKVFDRIPDETECMNAVDKYWEIHDKLWFVKGTHNFRSFCANIDDVIGYKPQAEDKPKFVPRVGQDIFSRRARGEE